MWNEVTRVKCSVDTAASHKILAYTGLSPSAYQSGQLNNCYAHIEKRGSRYLRYAIFNATKSVCIHDPTFAAYLTKKRSEGKHYNVAISHAAKKLMRLIYAMEKSGEPYRLHLSIFRSERHSRRSPCYAILLAETFSQKSHFRA